jgi:hypothetical protein
MFNLFKKEQVTLLKHQYKNLLISLPSNWSYEFDGNEQEACFDPKSKSTLRLHIIKAVAHQTVSFEEDLKNLTGNQPYTTTTRGYLLQGPLYRESVDNGQEIILITWKLINYVGLEKIIAVLTYTVLKMEQDSSSEKEIFKMIESSLHNAELS